MNKIEAIAKFGSVRKLAEALDISVQAVYQWPDELKRSIADRVELALLKKVTSSEVS
jgi:hypothetical protein